MSDTDNRPPYKYALRYECGPFTKEEANGNGLCDAIIVLSILYPPDGSYSMLPISSDGRANGRPMASMEIFKAWTLLGNWLSERSDLDAAMREIAAEPLKVVSMALRLGGVHE